MSTHQSSLGALAQFSIGFLGFMIVLSLFNLLGFMAVNRLFDYSLDTPTLATASVSFAIQLIGIGLAIRSFRGKMRWIGIGNFCAIFLFILGAILRSGCMPPLLLPFPLSLLSAC